MMLTRSVTALVPFVAQEVQSPQGIFYGRNAITGNLIVATVPSSSTAMRW